MTARTPRAISNDAFHQIRADYPERSFSKALLEGRITERDITLIRSFIAEMQSSRNTWRREDLPKSIKDEFLYKNYHSLLSK